MALSDSIMMELDMGAKKSFVAGAVLAGLAAMASWGLASEPKTTVPKPAASLPQDPWSQHGSSHAADSLHDAGSELDSKNPALDRSGGKRFGKASFYANSFAGRKMADGTIMDPQTNNAASRTLPLGTTAKVTNLETGKSAVVTIQDRGPYAGGRIVDLSPATAQKIGITRRDGIAKVEVAPIAVPMPDGRIKLGAAASDPFVAINLRNDKSTGAGW
jgi:rare lipoprotein A